MTRIYRQDVLRYLKIRPAQLRAWEQKGLIPHRDSYTLEETGRLRTLRDLSTKFSSSRISASLGAMKSVSGIDNPLLDARAIVGGSRVHFWHRGCMTEPIARQFVLNFDLPSAVESGTGGQAVPIEIHQNGRSGRLSDLFLEAIRCEDASDLNRAALLYDQILSFKPNHAAACINLGTICYNRRQFVRAEELYRRATVADPEYALAFFDLGNALDELKRLPEAIESYQAAVRLVSTYADAHYNLALAFDRIGERRLALRHWSAYLKLDPGSRWADHARKQIRKILDRENLSIIHRTPRPAGARPLRRNLRFDVAVPTAG